MEPFMERHQTEKRAVLARGLVRVESIGPYVTEV
jgi:hypothetical protein